MKKLILEIYLKSPYMVKRILANIEAIRRDYYRRPSDSLDDNIEDTIIDRLMNYDFSNNLFYFNSLLERANNDVPFYKGRLTMNIKSLKDIELIDVLTKKEIRENRNLLIADNTSIHKDLWRGNTSGSTGSPLFFFKDRKSMNSERESYDSYYKYLGCDINKNRVRISGVKVTTFDRKKKPYWLFIDKYRQLQCSAYHISKNTYKDYLEEFRKRKVQFGTGFPSSWTALAEVMLDDKITYEGLEAIITDSEGLSEDNKLKIEKAFKCPVYRTYGLGEVGMCAIECEQGNYHVLPTHFVEIIDEWKNIQPDGSEGEIIVTDYNSHRYPFIRYATGDLGVMHRTECLCGMKSPYLSKITGRLEDYIITKDGRKITRLTKIVSPAVGIKESQIIQLSDSKLKINVVPDYNFDPESMDKVLKIARDFVGDMEVTWEIVEYLERMPSGKLKFLIRKNIKDL